MEDFEASVKECISQSDLEGLKVLLQGKNINSPLKSGWTPLHHAGFEGQDIIVDYLLNCGASANCHYEFFTPLMAVCHSSSYDEEKLVKCARSLIEHNAEVNAMDKYKSTPLMQACTRGHEKLVSVLLDAHCDVNKFDNNGYSTLHMACMYNRPNVVRMLLAHGVDKNLRDQRGRLPIAVALSKGADDIIQMLDDEPKQEIQETVEKTNHKTCIRQKTSFEELLTELPCYNNSSGENGFHKDVAILLSGMKLETRVDLFLKKKVSLSQFLNIKNNELQDLGVFFSSHREKIIMGNKRFICRPWGSNSLPSCKKDQLQLMEIVRFLANSIKQLHIMWATTVYSNERMILPTNNDDQKVDDLYQVVLRTHRQTKALIKELKLIEGHVEYLEKYDNVQPADLILPIKRTKCISAGKIFFVSAFCAFVMWKSNFISLLRK